MASQGTEWEEHLFDVVSYLSSFFHNKFLSAPLVK